jgi:hypothetical protein
MHACLTAATGAKFTDDRIAGMFIWSLPSGLGAYLSVRFLTEYVQTRTLT